MRYKDSYFPGQPAFGQILDLIPFDIIGKLTEKYHTDRYYKSFFSVDHLVTMLFCGFLQCNSLRELVLGIQANADRLSHLGLKNTPRRSTLAEANAKRNADFFAAVYHELYRHFFSSPDSRLKPCESKFFIVDSTTISLFSMVMKGAGSYDACGKKKGGVKAHILIDSEHDLPAFVDLTAAKENDRIFLDRLDLPKNSTVVMDLGYTKYKTWQDWGKKGIRWVCRLHESAVYETISSIPLDQDSVDRFVLADSIVRLGRPSNRSKTPLLKARLVVYRDIEKNRIFRFITNDYTSSPQDIAGIYKRRWQIELVFKRIKQRYPLKYFLGETENAIKIQIWTALICDLLVKVLHNKVESAGQKKWSYSNISAVIRQHLMSYFHLLSFLTAPEKALLKEQKKKTQLKLEFNKGAVF
jgi:hypothetical protein